MEHQQGWAETLKFPWRKTLSSNKLLKVAWRATTESVMFTSSDRGLEVLRPHQTDTWRRICPGALSIPCPDGHPQIPCQCRGSQARSLPTSIPKGSLQPGLSLGSTAWFLVSNPGQRWWICHPRTITSCPGRSHIDPATEQSSEVLITVSNAEHRMLYPSSKTLVSNLSYLGMLRWHQASGL